MFRFAVRVRLLGWVGFASCLGLASGCVSRAESDVVVYSALDEEFAFPILNAFERSTDHETGVIPKFDVESTKTVGLVNRIIAEQDKPVCDLFWNNEIMHTVRLQKLGLLQTLNWDLPLGYPTDMVARDGTWCGFAARARVLLINTKLIPDPADYPTSVADLSDPKWENKCAMARPLFGTTATHFAVLRELQGREATLSQMQDIQKNAVILSGNKQVAQAVATGRVAWGLRDTDDAIIEKDSGEPVAIVFPDQAPDQAGALRIPNTIAVLKNAPHAVAAANLAEYLVSPQTEDRLAMGNSSQLPVHRGSKFPPRVLPSDPVRWMRVDFEAAAEGWDEWSKEVQEMFRD
ncbi:MAG: extracellular solute-binding protein [Planctomycetaceae bacterium]|nr:extracellular solute-binding protein [Planctomycetaceae bacterium]